MKFPSHIPVLTILAIVATSLLAATAELDIQGNYGDEAGCRHARTNDYSEEDLLLLTSQYVATQVTHCSFVQAFPAEDDSQVLLVTCGHEGDGEITLGLMRVQKAPDGVDAYRVFDQDGSMWGEVRRCP